MLIINVDDDSDDSEMFAAAIAEINPGIECISLESGIKLIEFLKTTKTFPDFIFMDINMPKFNGYESAQAIRANKELGAIQIVMYSTAFSPNDATRFTALGCKSLVKQGTYDGLVKSLKALIS